jgi:hypothetical protein
MSITYHLDFIRLLIAYTVTRYQAKAIALLKGVVLLEMQVL